MTESGWLCVWVCERESVKEREGEKREKVRERMRVRGRITMESSSTVCEREREKERKKEREREIWKSKRTILSDGCFQSVVSLNTFAKLIKCPDLKSVKIVTTNDRDRKRI